MGEYDYSAKTFRQELKQSGVFYTPHEQAEYLRSLLPDNVQEIYDPTCGNGGLLDVFSDSVEKYGQEIDIEQLEIAKQRLTNFHGVAGDTLLNPGFMDKSFQAIVANYPFSVSWSPIDNDERFANVPVIPPKSKADYAFILHILHLLADNGKAVVMCFPGILYRGQSEGKIREWIIQQNWIEKVIMLPGKKFDDTSISTAVIVFNKSKTTTDIIFVDDSQGLEHVATLEEVANNDYNLSPTNYIVVDDTRERIDAVALNQDCFAKCCNNFKQILKTNLQIHKIYPNDLQPIEYYTQQLQDVQKSIEQFKEALTNNV